MFRLHVVSWFLDRKMSCRCYECLGGECCPQGVRAPWENQGRILRVNWNQFSEVLSTLLPLFGSLLGAHFSPKVGLKCKK